MLTIKALNFAVPTNKAVFSRHLKETGIDKQRNFEGANTGLLQGSEYEPLIFDDSLMRARVWISWIAMREFV